jgi:hypothetical protein
LAFCTLTVPSIAYSDGTVQLDHSDGSITPFQTLTLAKGDNLFVQIINTNVACSDYNISAQAPDDKNKARPVNTTKLLTIVHDGKAIAYQVSATKRTGAAASCPALPNRTWTLPVFTPGWAVAFAGAFTIDTLTSHVYGLEAGVNSGVQGFYVRRNTANEDQASLGAAAMVHVYHSNFATFSNDVGWVPVSFGLGIGTSSSTRYFLGTSLRFGDQFFFTLGGVFGSVTRLPNGLSQGSFTTDANALASLPTGTRASLFASVSYSFLASSAKAALQVPFVSSTTPPAKQAPGGATPQISKVSWTDKPNGIAGIAGSGFGTDAGSVKVSMGGNASAVSSAADTTLSVTVAAGDRGKSTLSVIVTVGDSSSTAYSWDTTK